MVHWGVAGRMEAADDLEDVGGTSRSWVVAKPPDPGRCPGLDRSSRGTTSDVGGGEMQANVLKAVKDTTKWANLLLPKCCDVERHPGPKTVRFCLNERGPGAAYSAHAKGKAPVQPAGHVAVPTWVSPAADGGGYVQLPGGDEVDTTPSCGAPGAQQAFSQAELDATPTLVRGLYPLDLERAAGARGGVDMMVVCAGILNSVVTPVRMGLHIRRLIIIEKDAALRRLGAHTLEYLHEEYPDRLPAKAAADAYQAAAKIGHNAVNLTGDFLMSVVDPDGFALVCVEAPCQGLSSSGARQGLEHHSSRVIVPITMALGDLHLQLAQRRGFSVPYTAPAQFAYIFENVRVKAGPATPLLQQAAAYLERCWGQPVIHDAADAGACARRKVSVWTNLFEAALWAVMEPQLRRPPEWTATELCRAMAPELEPQRVVGPNVPAGGLNVKGQLLEIFPKLLASPSTYQMREHNDHPGAWMLVNRRTGELVKAPIAIRGAAHGVYPPTMAYLANNNMSESAAGRALGNIFAPASIAVVHEVAISQAVELQTVPMGSAEHLVKASGSQERNWDPLPGTEVETLWKEGATTSRQYKKRAGQDRGKVTAQELTAGLNVDGQAEMKAWR